MNSWLLLMLYFAISSHVLKGQSTKDDDEPSDEVHYIEDLDVFSHVMQIANKLEMKFEQAMGRLHEKIDQQSQQIVNFNQTLNKLQENIHQVAGSFLHQPEPDIGPVRRPVLTHVIRGANSVYSLTSFNNKLFVTRWTSAIAVYDATTFAWISNITVSEAGTQLFGLASCPAGDCLYVSDNINHKVHKLTLSTTPDGNTAVTATTSWSVGRYPYGLWINRQHNLLIALDGNKTVAEYTPSGSLVRATTDSINLFQAVEHVINGTFVVSHYQPVHGVALMSADGRVIHSYGNTTWGSGPGLMNQPRSLAVDREGYVLVAEESNNRILVLNPTLSDARPLPLPTDASGPLNRPMGLWLDESRGRLYVGESGAPYRVLVYDNVFNVGTLFSP